MTNRTKTARIAAICAVVLIGSSVGLWAARAAVIAHSREAVRVIETDPRSPEYDPIELVAALDADPWGVVISEPRVTEFAARREGFLSDRVRRLLDSSKLPVALDGVVCFASSCVIRVSSAEAGDTVVRDVTTALQAASPLFDYITPKSPPRRYGVRRMEFAVLFRPDSRAHDGYERRIELPQVSSGRL
jgi:hypothetical protein